MPFGVEVMGRVRELGTIDDVLAIASQVDFVRPVLDFAHMHATSDGAFTDVDAFATRSRPDRRRARARRAVPHPLQRHRLREPQRDEPSALRRGHAARRAAARRARALRPAGDRDQRVARRSVDSGDRRGAARRELRAAAPRSARPRRRGPRARKNSIAVSERPALRARGSRSTAGSSSASSHQLLPPPSSRPCAARTLASAIFVVEIETAILGPDRLARLEREALRLLEPPQPGRDLGERALRLAEPRPVVRGPSARAPRRAAASPRARGRPEADGGRAIDSVIAASRRLLPISRVELARRRERGLGLGVVATPVLRAFLGRPQRVARGRTSCRSRRRARPMRSISGSASSNSSRWT